MNYSQLFKQARVKLGLSMAQLALALGVSRQSVWNVETGACKPSLELLEALVRVTGESIEIKAQLSTPKTEKSAEN